jgi:hypothetical protein
MDPWKLEDPLKKQIRGMSETSIPIILKVPPYDWVSTNDLFD